MGKKIVNTTFINSIEKLQTLTQVHPSSVYKGHRLLFHIKAVSKILHFFGCSHKNEQKKTTHIVVRNCRVFRAASPSPCSAADVHAPGRQGSGEGGREGRKEGALGSIGEEKIKCHNMLRQQQKRLGKSRGRPCQKRGPLQSHEAAPLHVGIKRHIILDGS